VAGTTGETVMRLLQRGLWPRWLALSVIVAVVLYLINQAWAPVATWIFGPA